MLSKEIRPVEDMTYAELTQEQAQLAQSIGMVDSMGLMGDTALKLIKKALTDRLTEVTYAVSAFEKAKYRHLKHVGV